MKKTQSPLFMGWNEERKENKCFALEKRKKLVSMLKVFQTTKKCLPSGNVLRLKTFNSLIGTPNYAFIIVNFYKMFRSMCRERLLFWFNRFEFLKYVHRQFIQLKIIYAPTECVRLCPRC